MLLCLSADSVLCFPGTVHVVETLQTAEDLNHVLQDSAHVAALREGVFRIPREGPGSFLRYVIKPFYNIAKAVSEPIACTRRPVLGAF